MSREPVFVGLGSNQDEPVAQLSRAVRAMGQIPTTRIQAVSSFYANPPMGPPDQPEFVNAVVWLTTDLAPLALLDVLLAIELDQGRVRGAQRWGPRTLDLDLLLYGTRCMRHPRLVLPHPGLCERPFVLHPLAEIAPHAPVPGHAEVHFLARKVCADGLQRLQPPSDRSGRNFTPAGSHPG